MKEVRRDIIMAVVSLLLIIIGVTLEMTSPGLNKWVFISIYGLAFLIGGFAKAKEGILKTILMLRYCL